jgi:hypothetical protein
VERIAFITLILALSILACSETDETPDLSGETHWLKACDGSDECGKLQCLCGYCVAECASDGACNVEGRDTGCNPVGSYVVNAICTGFEDEKDLCLEECTNDDDCNQGEACLEGSCVPHGIAERETDIDAGVGPDAGVDGDAGALGGNGDGGDGGVGQEETVVSAETGLTWMKCAAGLSGADCSEGSLSVLSFQDAVDYCETLEFAGYDDWRLPAVLELVTLVDINTYDPAIDTDEFPGDSSGLYVSSSSIDNTDIVWCVFFRIGVVLVDSKSEGYNVRCLRGAPAGTSRPFEESVISGERVVSDEATGLMWQGCPAGVSGDACQQGSSATYTWEEAHSYCEDLTWADYDDWRLPDYYELSTIINYETYNPSIDTDGFPSTPSENFWSSSLNVGDTDRAWYVDFSFGTENVNDKTNAIDVRCARGVYAP